jgi:hypothetical protein
VAEHVAVGITTCGGGGRALNEGARPEMCEVAAVSEAIPEWPLYRLLAGP